MRTPSRASSRPRTQPRSEARHWTLGHRRLRKISTPDAVALINGADAGVSESQDFERRACHPRVAHSGCGIPDPPRHRRSRTSSSARRGAGPGHGQGRRSTGLNVQPLWIIVGHEQQLSEKQRAKRSRDLLQRGIKSNWWRKKWRLYRPPFSVRFRHVESLRLPLMAPSGR